ncbi:hypothetical protein H0H92_009308 [Tricholoma furcatifolium]|nr:hypothetical protein H0H92_009308 [Tricholoma furcatifolium]
MPSHLIQPAPHLRHTPTLMPNTPSPPTLPVPNPSLLQDHTSAPISTIHIKAHTSTNSVPANLNRLADTLASSAHYIHLPPISAPLPTFSMDPFTPYTDHDGWIETPIQSFVTNHLFRAHISHLVSPLSSLLLQPYLYDTRPPPDYPYSRAPSSFSAVVQLYLRAHQLDTAERLANRLPDRFDPCCRFGCRSIETEHHIFVSCPFFNHLREDTTKQLVSQTITILDIFCIPEHLRLPILSFTNHAVCDSNVWPAGLSFYYYGVHPKIDNITSNMSESSLSSQQIERLRSRLANTWHGIFIRLAGRIWGSVRRLSNTTQSSATSGVPLVLPQNLMLHRKMNVLKT